MASFEIAIEKLLILEGGYSNRSGDLGGETNFGISKRQFPNLNIKNLKKEDAIEIYRDGYWNRYRLVEIKNQEIANYIFNMVVNADYTKMIIRVQKVLNMTASASLILDGTMGTATFSALNSIPNTDQFLNSLRLDLIKYYVSIVQRDRLQSSNLIGWINRALA